MHYELKKGVVKSEYAAKSNLQKSAHLCSVLKGLGPQGNVLDFGCGKLRYYREMNSISKKLYLHDSKVQLERDQIIHGKETTVVDFVKSRSKCSVLSRSDFKKRRGSFDFILCSNVLSAIPDAEIRSKCVSDIRGLLGLNGIALFVCQFRNSYFKEYEKRKGAVRHLDGWLYSVSGSLHFYGLLTPVILRELIESNGLTVGRQVVKEGSVYVFATKYRKAVE